MAFMVVSYALFVPIFLCIGASTRYHRQRQYVRAMRYGCESVVFALLSMAAMMAAILVK